MATKTLKDRLQALDLKDLSKRSKVPLRTLQRLRTGDNEPRVLTLAAIEGAIKRKRR